MACCILAALILGKIIDVLEALGLMQSSKGQVTAPARWRLDHTGRLLEDRP